MCIFGFLETGEGYFLLPKNEICSQNMGIAVDNANSCEKALNEIKREIPLAQFNDKPIEDNIFTRRFLLSPASQNDFSGLGSTNKH